MNAMAMCYDPKVSYKNDLIFKFMNFNATHIVVQNNEKYTDLPECFRVF